MRHRLAFRCLIIVAMLVVPLVVTSDAFAGKRVPSCSISQTDAFTVSFSVYSMLHTGVDYVEVSNTTTGWAWFYDVGRRDNFWEGTLTGFAPGETFTIQAVSRRDKTLCSAATTTGLPGDGSSLL